MVAALGTILAQLVRHRHARTHKRPDVQVSEPEEYMEARQVGQLVQHPLWLVLLWLRLLLRPRQWQCEKPIAWASC